MSLLLLTNSLVDIITPWWRRLLVCALQKPILQILHFILGDSSCHFCHLMHRSSVQDCPIPFKFLNVQYHITIVFCFPGLWDDWRLSDNTFLVFLKVANSYMTYLKVFLVWGCEQAVILQPLGDDGVLVVASDTIRGFTSRDQVLCHSLKWSFFLHRPICCEELFWVKMFAREPCRRSQNRNVLFESQILMSIELVQAWLGTIAEKLDTSLEQWVDTSTSNLEGQVSH